MRRISSCCLALFFSGAIAQAQSVFPELMYGVYGLDDSCDLGARRMIITPTDILVADPGLDVRVNYPDQRQVSEDSVALSGNFFVSVLYDGTIERTADGARMAFHFPDLSFPLLEPMIRGVLGGDVPTAIRATLDLVESDDQVVMTLQSDDPSLGARLSDTVGTWVFEAAQITRTRGEAISTYARCFDGLGASAHHARLIADKTGIYAPEGRCTADEDLFVIAEDGWGLSIPFTDPTIGFAFAAQGSDLLGELYRAPFAPLAPNENSYIDIEVRDGALHHRLSFAGQGFTWTKTLSNGQIQEAGTFTKCGDIAEARFADAILQASQL